MTKLYLRIEHTSTGTNTPSYQRLCNSACFQCFTYFIFFDTTNFSSLYNLLCKILSIIPPVLPILKQPGFTPPTVAGPIIVTFLRCAARIIFLVIFSGIPSAIIAIVLICGNCNVSMVQLFLQKFLYHIRLFSIKTYVLDKTPNKDKFALRGVKRIFVGYSEISKAYQI
ncbi:hypothetical protein ALC62_10368 [Cyphomyrmex costatus]|uniref:Uncharacterized protein n=1 Tax=Cyphomyrmex costatus TaxID=456900 RepID=A0A151IDV3_9HYME|nr:hypothetical protein ALC62_10368 [Cyphomyrmex costatus]